MDRRRAQYTTEYVIILGIAMAVIAAALVYALFFYTSYSSSSSSNQISTAAAQIVQAANYVSAQGADSKTVIAVTFPLLSVQSSFFCGDIVELGSRASSYIDQANVNMSGLMPFIPGLYHAYLTFNGTITEMGLNFPLSSMDSSFSYSSGSIDYSLEFFDENGDLLPDVTFNITVYSESGAYIASQTETSSNGQYSGSVPVSTDLPLYIIRVFPRTYQVFYSACFFN